MNDFTKYNICGSKPDKDDASRRHFFQVGALFLDEAGKGSINLDSLPVDFDGRLHVFPVTK